MNIILLFSQVRPVRQASLAMRSSVLCYAMIIHASAQSYIWSLDDCNGK